MRTRLAVLVLVATLWVASPAAAGPGGALSGELSVRWTTGADAQPGITWDGAVTLALQPGDGPTQTATRALRDSGRTHRAVNPYFVQASRVASLEGTRVWRAETGCSDAEGNGYTGEARTESTVTQVTQPLVPMEVDQPQLDLLRGRGTVEVGFYTDNPGYETGLPWAGEYFMPVPGTAQTSGFESTCGERRDNPQEGSVFSTQGDALVPFAFAEWLNEVELKLVRGASGWSGDVVRTGRTGPFDDMPLDLTYRARLKLEKSPRSIGALCREPSDRQMRAAGTVGQARRILSRAGFPKARFRGGRPWQGVKPGRFFVDPDFTSSGYRACGAKANFYRAQRVR